MSKFILSGIKTVVNEIDKALPNIETLLEASLSNNNDDEDEHAPHKLLKKNFNHGIKLISNQIKQYEQSRARV